MMRRNRPNHNTDPSSRMEDDASSSSIPPSSSSLPSKPVSLGRLLSLARPESRGLIVALVLMVMAEGLDLYNPILLANAYDYLVDPTLSSDTRMNLINQTMVVVLVIHMCSVAALWGRQVLLGGIGERVVARLRNNLFAHIVKQDISFFDEIQSGELVSRMGSDTTLLQQAVSQAVPEVAVGIVKLVVSMALMFWISPSLAGVTMSAVVLVFVLCAPFGTLMARLSKQYQDVLGLAQIISTEVFGSVRTVQSFTAEQREQERFRSKIGDPSQFKYWWPTSSKTTQEDKETTYAIGLYQALVQSTFITIVFGLGFACLYVCLWYGFKLVNDELITLGDLTAFQTYVFQIGAALGTTSAYMAQLAEAQGASGRIFFLLDRIPDIPKPHRQEGTRDTTTNATDDNDDEEDASSPSPHDTNDRRSHVPRTPPSSMQGRVEFRNVDFSYSSRRSVPVLHNFNLVIPPNSTAALCGSSGSGKTTVVSLLQRFYDVTAGSITIDGIDISDLDLKWLRSHIGFVQQEPVLFGMTCRDNVLYGVNRMVSQEELEDVCRAAHAHDFIQEWPEGYDTMVGERGVKLSGGQKQRLSIARALLVNPRIVLLDEATAALDAESEHLVQEAIQRAAIGRTVLIVAHRLSTIQNADQIVVVDHGGIVDIGKHDELLHRCAKYIELIKRQSMLTTHATPVDDASLEVVQ